DMVRPALLAGLAPLVNEIIERSGRHNGPEAVQTLDARIQLADIEWQRGRCRAAVDICRAVLEKMRQRLGECHGLRHDAYRVLSYALPCLGETREPADISLKRIACLRQAGYSGNDPVLVGAISDSLRFLERDGRGAEGESQARELAASIGTLGGTHEFQSFA